MKSPLSLARLPGGVKNIFLVISLGLLVALTGCQSKKADGLGCLRSGCCSACRLPGVPCDCAKCPCCGDGCQCCSHCPGSETKKPGGCCGSK